MTPHSESNKNNKKNVIYQDTILSEVLSAAMGGAFSSTCLYPLEVVKTKMMHEEGVPRLSNDDDQKSDDERKHNGNVDKTEGDEEAISGTKSLSMVNHARHLYQSHGRSVFFAGWEVSAFQSAIEKALYFFAFTAFKSLYWRYTRTRKRSSPPPPPSSSFDSRSQSLSTVTTLLLGCLAEWAHLPITLPIDALTTVIQTRKNTGTTSNREKVKGSRECSSSSVADGHRAMAILLTLLRNKTMYKGIEAYFLLCFRPAIQYTVFEQVKAFILKTRQRRLEKDIHGMSNSSTPSTPLSSVLSLSTAEAFALGMIARALATLVIFPFQRAKVRLQSTACCHGSDPLEYDNTDIGDGTDASTSFDNRMTTSIWQMLEQTYKEQGIGGLFQGLGPELTRGVLSAALMMMVKERMSESVKTVLYNTRGRKQNIQ